MCEYCEKYYSEKGMITGKSIKIKECAMSTDLTDCNVYRSPNENPAIIIFSMGMAKGYMDINFCPMCGEKLSDEER